MSKSSYTQEEKRIYNREYKRLKRTAIRHYRWGWWARNAARINAERRKRYRERKEQGQR